MLLIDVVGEDDSECKYDRKVIGYPHWSFGFTIVVLL